MAVFKMATATDAEIVHQLKLFVNNMPRRMKEAFKMPAGWANVLWKNVEGPPDEESIRGIYKLATAKTHPLRGKELRAAIAGRWLEIEKAPLAAVARPEAIAATAVPNIEFEVDEKGHFTAVSEESPQVQASRAAETAKTAKKTRVQKPKVPKPAIRGGGPAAVFAKTVAEAPGDIPVKPPVPEAIGKWSPKRLLAMLAGVKPEELKGWHPGAKGMSRLGKVGAGAGGLMLLNTILREAVAGRESRKPPMMSAEQIYTQKRLQQIQQTRLLRMLASNPEMLAGLKAQAAGPASVPGKVVFGGEQGESPVGGAESLLAGLAAR